MPPFRLTGPDTPQFPVLIAVPHAGRAYPPAMSRASLLPVARLRALEDRLADVLVADAVAAGFQAIIADVPRAWIDLNRAEHEFDPGLVSAPEGLQPRPSRKVAAGLGIIPRRIGNGGDIWRGSIAASEFADRLTRIYRPWHAAIGDALASIAGSFGVAILIDLHSMPPLGGRQGDGAEIVFGDLFGRSAHGWVADLAIETARCAGFRAAMNAPYAGGHTIERHAAPQSGIHAIQVEISRSLYLDTARVETGPGLPRTRQFVTALAKALADAALRRSLPLAAE